MKSPSQTKILLTLATIGLLSACGATSDVSGNFQGGASVDSGSIRVQVFEPLVAGDCSSLAPSNDKISLKISKAPQPTIDADGIGGGYQATTQLTADADGAGGGKAFYFSSSGTCGAYVIEVSGNVIGDVSSVLVQLGGQEANVVVEADGRFAITYSVDSLSLGALKITAVESTGNLTNETLFLSFNL